MTGVPRGVPVDQQARDRAVSDLDSSYCMEAGAGTGKTTLLVGRYLSIIRSGRAGCRQIVAITFTEKAAAEMKSRLRRDLEKALSDSGPESDARAYLSAAIDELEGAPISTIHAFASSILREYPVEAGVDPGFKLLDEIEGAILLDECWSAFLGSASKDEAGLLRTWDMAGGSPARLRDIAMSLYYNRGRSALSGLFDHESRAGSSGQDGGDGLPGEGRLADLFEQAAERLGSLLESAQVDPEDKGLPRVRSFLEGMDVLRSRTGRIEEDDALVFAVPKGAGSMSNWDPPEACREQKAILQGLAGAQVEVRTRVVTGMRGGLTEWLQGFLDSVEKRKKEEGLLDFDDLLISARKLVDDLAVLESIRRRYRYFLVDEFQDTDPVQAELVMLLAGGGRRGEKILPDPGRLFIVGDPKQSIYRFRKADIEIYEKVKRRFRESGSLLRISQNFRSLPGVTEWVNALFSRIITCPEGRYYQPDYEPVHAWRKGDEAAVISLGLDPDETGADSFRRTEGGAVAGFIRALVDSGREVMDPVERSPRPVRLGDIAVLYRGTTGIEHYEDSLRAGGIPYIVEGGKLYYTRQEIRDISNAMWAVEDPRDPLALVACLRSGFFGFNDEELLLFRAGGGRFDYLDPGQPSGGISEDLSGAFGILAGLHRDRNVIGSASSLKRLLRVTGYMELSLLQTHGRQRVDNIRKALDTARSFDSSHHSFRYYARWMRDQERLGAAEGESPVIDGDENAVRLMTVHKSKGLQFPVVIIVNLVQRVSSPGKLLMTSSGLPSFDLGEGWCTGDFGWTSEEEKVKDMAETARLLYVASTRAGDLLVVPRNPGAKGHYEIISSGFEDILTPPPGTNPIPSGGKAGEVLEMRAGDLESQGGVEGDGPAGGGRSRRTAGEMADDMERWKNGLETALARGCRSEPFLTPSSLAAHGLEGPPGEVEWEISSRREAGYDSGLEAAMERGSVFHRVMESIDLKGETDATVFTRDMLAGTVWEDMAGDIAGLVDRTIGTELIERAASARRVFREVPFSIPLCRLSTDAGGSGLPERSGMLEGRIDLLFEDDEGWTVVDYKTDDVLPGREAERVPAYTAQAGAYALALDSMGLSPVNGVYLLFAGTGTAVKVDVDGPGLSSVRQRILSAAGLE